MLARRRQSNGKSAPPLQAGGSLRSWSMLIKRLDPAVLYLAWTSTAQVQECIAQDLRLADLFAPREAGARFLPRRLPLQ